MIDGSGEMAVKKAEDFTIGVIGSGTMGLGVATHFAMRGHPVHLFTRAEETLRKAQKQVAENLRSMQELGVIDGGTAKAAEGLVSYYTDMKSAVSDVDMVIENVLENVEVKKSTFAQLDAYCRKDAILASNTSSLNIYVFLEVSNRERLVITHFFVPAYVMPLVEIVRGPETSDETVAVVKELMSSTGKNPAVVNKVVPGFIMNRLTFAIFREAAYMVSQGWCRPEDVDAAVVSTHGPRYAFEGPFGLVDFAGVDTYEKIAEYLLPELCSDGAVPPALKTLYDQGDLGVKTGSGFYSYGDGVRARAKRDEKIVRMIQAIGAVNKDS